MKEAPHFLQPWLPGAPGAILEDRTLFLEDILSPPGRYRSPLSLRARVEMELERRMRSATASADLSWYRDPLYPVPPRWQSLVDYLHEAGVIAHPRVQFEQLFHDEPKIYSLRLWAASPEGKTDGGIELVGGGYSRGVSHDLEEAISKVIGELLERYPLTLYRNKDLFRASVADLKRAGAHFFDPFLAPRFSEEQKKRFPNRRFDEKSVFRWVKGKSLVTEREAFIPAQLVFWNYRFEAEEPVLEQPITNGAAGHFTREEAILAGLYELIQRDAFFVHWLNKIAPPRIDPASIKDPSFQKIFGDLTRFGIYPELLDVTSDIGIPSFVCVLTDGRGKESGIALGGGCDPNAESAIVRAMTEAMGVSHWLRMRGEYATLPEPYEPFSIPLGQEGRLKLWGNPAMRSRFDFFLSGPRIALHDRSGVAVPRVLEILRERGREYEPFVYEATHPVLEKLGYCSVAVAVPALLPLYLNETMAPLASRRIKDPLNVNPLPHPFP